MSFRSLFGFLNKKSSCKSSSTKKSSQKTKQRKTKKRQPKPFNTPDITSINIDNHDIVNDGELVFSDINENPNIAEEYIPQLSKEMITTFQENANAKHSQKLLDSRLLSLALATDRSTAIQICSLLGIIKYCMEKSGEGVAGDNKIFEFKVRIQNRNNSPFMIGIGDDYIESIPIVEEVVIGN